VPEIPEWYITKSGKEPIEVQKCPALISNRFITCLPTQPRLDPGLDLEACAGSRRAYECLVVVQGHAYAGLDARFYLHDCSPSFWWASFMGMDGRVRLSTMRMRFRSHRRQPVTSRSHQFAYVHKEWHSCRGKKRRAHSAAMRLASRERICAIPPGPSYRLGNTEAGPRCLHICWAEAALLQALLLSGGPDHS
jgi:hypothetical protein